MGPFGAKERGKRLCIPWCFQWSAGVKPAGTLKVTVHLPPRTSSMPPEIVAWQLCRRPLHDRMDEQLRRGEGGGGMQSCSFSPSSPSVPPGNGFRCGFRRPPHGHVLNSFDTREAAVVLTLPVRSWCRRRMFFGVGLVGHRVATCCIVSPRRGGGSSSLSPSSSSVPPGIVLRRRFRWPRSEQLRREGGGASVSCPVLRRCRRGILFSF